MKKLFFAMALLAFIGKGYSQEKEIDSTAIFILDKMSDVIGDLKSVSFNMESVVDRFDAEKNIETKHGNSSISMVGPDKLLAISSGDRGNYGFWYNGTYLTYYSFDENNYVTLDAPDTILTMIDSMHVSYGFKFPAADFFYPSFTDDLMDSFNSIKYLGKKMIAGEQCYHIQATSPDTDLQLWITSTGYMLPKKLIIIYKNEEDKRYEATFNTWKLNPNIPSSIFEFTPPPHSRLISIMAKS